MSRPVAKTLVQGASNRILGSLILLVALALFGVYTLWTIVLPFLPDDASSAWWIPDRRWAITIPSLVLVLGLTTVGVYTGWLLRKDALQDLDQQQQQQQQRRLQDLKSGSEG